MFQEGMQFHFTIVLCYKQIDYCEGYWSNASSSNLEDVFFPTIFTCVLNQSCGYWLLRNALHSTISMNLKLKEKNQVVPSCEILLEDDLVVVDELVLLVFKTRKEVCGVFISFLKNMKMKKPII